MRPMWRTLTTASSRPGVGAGPRAGRPLAASRSSHGAICSRRIFLTLPEVPTRTLGSGSSARRIQALTWWTLTPMRRAASGALSTSAIRTLLYAQSNWLT